MRLSSWHVVDEEFNRSAIDLLKTADTLLFGRVTYQLFENYWPGAAADPKLSESGRAIAIRIDEMRKIVFTKTLAAAGWKNSRLLREVIPEQVLEMKRRPGKDMLMYGSGTVARSFMKAGLIDEYRIFVNPVILGSGTPLFERSDKKTGLKLLSVLQYKSGLVQLRYKPA